MTDRVSHVNVRPEDRERERKRAFETSHIFHFNATLLVKVTFLHGGSSQFSQSFVLGLFASSPSVSM